MSIQLPNSGVVFLPQVPKELKSNHELYDYLVQLDGVLTKALRAQFNNSNILVVAVNSGTTGTFTLSSGGSIVVTNGIVVTVTS